MLLLDAMIRPLPGQVLAVLGMTFPFHKEQRIHVNPLFDGRTS